MAEVTLDTADVAKLHQATEYLTLRDQSGKVIGYFVPVESCAPTALGGVKSPLTAEERTLFERDLKNWHEAFVKIVSENRNIPIENVAKLADGSSMAASLALENKLIDALGDTETAREWFAKQLGISKEEVVFCK